MSLPSERRAPDSAASHAVGLVPDGRTVHRLRPTAHGPVTACQGRPVYAIWLNANTCGLPPCGRCNGRRVGWPTALVEYLVAERRAA